MRRREQHPRRLRAQVRRQPRPLLPAGRLRLGAARMEEARVTMERLELREIPDRCEGPVTYPKFL